METVFHKYKQKQFFACLELLKSLPESGDMVENFLMDNCRLICESFIKIMANDPDKICEMQELQYMQFEKVISISNVTTVPLEIKLNATFNFIFWLSFCNDNEVDDQLAEEYLKLLYEGLATVLGGKFSLESTSSIVTKVMSRIVSLKEFISTEDLKTVLQVLELVVVIIFYMIKLKRPLISECLSVVDLFIKEAKYIVDSLESVNEFLLVKPVTLCLCKFNLNGTAGLLSELNLDVVDHLYLLKSVLLYLLEDFKGSLKCLQSKKTLSVESLWNYLVILNAYELENWALCSGFVTKMSTLVVEKNLKARLHILQGKLACIERNHKAALHQFQGALAQCPHCPIVYCYIGQVYGKIGLYDMMLENFTKLVEALELEEPEGDFLPNFETALLSWIHPFDEITQVEAYYALAVSYGLNEDFQGAAEAFERVLQLWNDEPPKRKKRSMELPSFLTVLHEAAVMNLMLGNLVRAEQIVLDAIDQYVPQESNQQHRPRTSVPCKDAEWLQRLIQQELLEIDTEPKELAIEVLYPEDLIFVFPQNVIGLLILSEIQRIQGIEDYKTTLSTVFSIFSKYLASSDKKPDAGREKKCPLTLIRALAGKTCVKIATIQMELSDHLGAEKMLKRGLSCNKGDKDALCSYYKFLLKSGKNREALKLWNTFFNEKESVAVDSLQSFSLRYFLTDKITKRDLEKIQQGIESSAVKAL